jgi:hypothetical protein
MAGRQRNARASSVDVPGAADAYLTAGPSSVQFRARRTNVFTEVWSIEQILTRRSAAPGSVHLGAKTTAENRQLDG